MTGAALFALVACTEAPAERPPPLPASTSATPGVAIATATIEVPPPSPSSVPATPTPPDTAPTVESSPSIAVHDPALAALLQDVAGDAQGSYGVYVKNLADGSGASMNPDKAFHAASLFKLYVMWDAFRQEAEGSISFDDAMEVTPYYKSWELGTNVVEVGDLVTVREALGLMMSISDTPTGVLLQDTLGASNVNAALEELDIHNSGLFYPGNPVATARDVGVLLEAIAEGGTLPAAAHQDMIELLTSTRIDNGLRAGVPAEVRVAHKTGSLPMALHDAGIVYLPDNAYVLVVLWDRQGDADLIQLISRRVYEYYEARD
jgi:beta-lactamase class A